MRNDTSSEIIIKMRNIDNAVRFTERLQTFCRIASYGGDAELFIKLDGEMKSCGFVAHDLSVRSVKHTIATRLLSNFLLNLKRR